MAKRPFSAGALDEDATHGIGRRGEEVRATVPELAFVAGQLAI
jgi:hypothetical protein